MLPGLISSFRHKFWFPATNTALVAMVAAQVIHTNGYLSIISPMSRAPHTKHMA